MPLTGPPFGGCLLGHQGAGELCRSCLTQNGLHGLLVGHSVACPHALHLNSCQAVLEECGHQVAHQLLVGEPRPARMLGGSGQLGPGQVPDVGTAAPQNLPTATLKDGLRLPTSDVWCSLLLILSCVAAMPHTIPSCAERHHWGLLHCSPVLGRDRGSSWSLLQLAK